MACAASVIAVLVVYSYADSFWPAVELLLLFVSIPVAWYSSTWIACVLHASGMLAYTIGRLGSPLGFDLAYLTHWFVAATLLTTLALAVTTCISWLLYSSCVSQGRYIVWLENLTALLIVALVSMQLFLTIASLGIISGYDGSLMQASSVQAISWRSASLQWATQHCLGFFFAAALVGAASKRRTSASRAGCCAPCGLRFRSCSHRAGRFCSLRARAMRRTAPPATRRP